MNSVSLGLLFELRRGKFLSYICWNSFYIPPSKFVYFSNSVLEYIQIDRVQDIHEEQGFWITILDWLGIRLNQFECLKNMKAVYQDENNFVLDENSAERNPCINR